MGNATQIQRSSRVVVIGAGMGGLAAAIRLAQAGCTVTVVDAMAGPGGKMRTVPSVVGPVDAGPTVLTMRSVFDDLFALAGQRLDDHLTLIPQPILARHWWPDGSTLDLHADLEASAQAVNVFAGPKAEVQFRRFDALTARAFALFEGPVMQSPKPQIGAIVTGALRNPGLWPMLMPGMTLARSLAMQFSDPRLRQLFGRYTTYVGGSPYRTPAVLGLVWQAEARGVWAVQGGMHQLALGLERLATQVGVTFRYGVKVDKIAEHWGCVNAVFLNDGTSLQADQVVFNGDPAALTTGLLGRAAKEALPPTAAYPRSLSAQVWSFAATIKGPQGAKPLIHHNVFFGRDPRAEFLPISRGEPATDPTLYICSQDRALGPVTGPERFEIILNAPAATSPTENEDQRCRDMTLHQLDRFGLTFDPLPTSADLTTPTRFAQMFPASMGSIYGRSPEGAMAAFQRPPARTALKGLYLAGGGAHPGAGVPMAALSGKHAAEAILHDRTLASRSGQTATLGGTSTGSATTASAPSPSSGS
jgi:1-hydroxycarotenoid 3,4-desaturase